MKNTIMIFILSPAKKMQEQVSEINDTQLTTPIFMDRSQLLLEKISLYSPQELGSLMKVSDSLAWKNKQRYHDILDGHAVSYPAIELFAGDVYRGLDYFSLDESEREYIQKKLIILSGLYGALRANDEISPYRLEMGIPLQLSEYKNLYEFWGHRVQEYLEKLVLEDSPNNPVLVNLASQEYARVLDFKKLPYLVITPVFKRKDAKTGRYKVVGILAKHARGLMLRYAAQNKITDSELLKQFNLDAYIYREDLSTSCEWVFVQED